MAAKSATTNPEDLIEDFSMSDLSGQDTATMAVVVNGRVSNWEWTFAGPGHAQAVAQSNRLARQRLHTDREQEQARVNGKKWKATEESPDDVRARNVTYVVERLLSWSPVKLDGELTPFSPEKARELLSDPSRINLLTQALEFIGDDNAFTRRSA